MYTTDKHKLDVIRMRYRMNMKYKNEYYSDDVKPTTIKTYENILDGVPDSIIENYLRKKKLKKISK